MGTNNTIACYTQNLAIKMPSAFYKMTPEQIAALVSMDRGQWGPLTLAEWGSSNDAIKLHYHLKAWWTLRGAKNPDMATIAQEQAQDYDLDTDPDKVWVAQCKARGWYTFKPKIYRDLEDEFLPRPIANIRLITARCPQMAMLRALGGDVSEPYWWAGLSVTEHAEPNLSRKCSDGYPGFSEAELEYRQERIRNEGTKPARCERFDTVNPGVCNSCRFSGVINSPIALGFEHEPKGARHE